MLRRVQDGDVIADIAARLDAARQELRDPPLQERLGAGGESTGHQHCSSAACTTAVCPCANCRRRQGERNLSHVTLPYIARSLPVMHTGDGAEKALD